MLSPLDRCRGVASLGHMENVFLVCWRFSILLSRVTDQFAVPPGVTETKPGQHLFSVIFLLGLDVCILKVVLIHIYLVAKYDECFLWYLSVIFMIFSFENSLFRSLEKEAAVASFCTSWTIICKHLFLDWGKALPRLRTSSGRKLLQFLLVWGINVLHMVVPCQ